MPECTVLQWKGGLPFSVIIAAELCNLALPILAIDLTQKGNVNRSLLRYFLNISDNT